MQKGDTINLAIHFHGSAKVINYGACDPRISLVTTTINLGSGLSRHEKPLQQLAVFVMLLSALHDKLEKQELFVDQLIISGFSAGYGAIRAILNNSNYAEQVDAVLLLDGLHTDYIPEGKPLFHGGSLNEEKLMPFLKFAQKAMAGTKKILVTHSAIFPGTYASTTECTDFIIKDLGLSRSPY